MTNRKLIMILATLLLLIGPLVIIRVAGAPGLQIADSATAEGVDSSTYQPINRTQTFNVKEHAVYSWIEFANVYSPSHNITWVWRTPQGHVYFRSSATIPDPGSGHYYTQYYVYDSIYVNVSTAAQLPGSWQVHVYADGAVTLVQDFTIADNTPPVQPTEGWSWPTYNIAVNIQSGPSYAYQDVVHAMSQWNYSQMWLQQQYGLAPRQTFRLIVSTSPAAPIKVVFNQTQTGANWGWTWCNYYYSGNRTFTSVTCSISIILAYANGQKLNDIALQVVSAHELGHALGLGHVLRAGDLMNHQSGNMYDEKYPTTLNLFTLYQLSGVKQYGVMAPDYTLPSGIPYVSSPAYNQTTTTTSTTAATTTASTTTPTSTPTSTSYSASTSTLTSSSTVTTSTSTTPIPEFPDAGYILALSVSMVAIALVFTRTRRPRHSSLN